MLSLSIRQSYKVYSTSEKRGNSRIIESKCCLCLIYGNLSRDLGNVPVKRPTDEIIVTEDERFFEVKPDRNDIFRISFGKLVGLFHFQFMLEQELLVVYMEHKISFASRV